MRWAESTDAQKREYVNRYIWRRMALALAIFDSLFWWAL